MSYRACVFARTAAVALLSAAVPTVAAAQNLFLTSGSHVADDATYADGNIYAGLNSLFLRADGANNPYVADLSVVAGADVDNVYAFNTSTTTVSGGIVRGLRGYDTSTTSITGGTVTTFEGFQNSVATITGGSVNRAVAFLESTVNVGAGSTVRTVTSGDSGTVNITGGDTTDAFAFRTSTLNIGGGNVTGNVANFNAATVNISGGIVRRADGNGSGVMHISGGTVESLFGFSSSITRISGGALTKGVLLFNTTATANFVGAGLTSVYQGYGNSNPYTTFADFFQVSGTFNGVPKTYDLYIRNTTGTGNGTPRQFAFASFVVVPESGTFALVLPVLAIVCVSVARRRWMPNTR